MNVRTGGVVAMAKLSQLRRRTVHRRMTPSSTSQLAHSAGLPVVDKALPGARGPPGSTFKLISSSGLLQRTARMPTERLYHCPTTFQHRHNFEGETGTGKIRSTRRSSCPATPSSSGLAYADWVPDNALINAGKQPVEGVQHMARDYGLGENPGVDLPGAADRAHRRPAQHEAQLAADQGRLLQGRERTGRFSCQHRLDDRDYCRVRLHLPAR